MCHGNPGWFRPGEARRAAASLGMTFGAFFKKYLIVEFWEEGFSGPTHVLAPRRVTQPDGQTHARWSDNFSKGQCRLLGPNGCKLSSENRPYECACTLSSACLNNKGDERGTNHREEIKELWEPLQESDELREVENL